MNDILSLLYQLKQHGVPITILLLVAAVAYLFLFPEKAQLVSYWIYRGIYSTGSFTKRRYWSVEIGRRTNDFFRTFVPHSAAEFLPRRIKIQWVKSKDVGQVTADGQLIVRIKDSKDEHLNTLLAAKVALPFVVIPRLRGALEPSLEEAIDLTLLRRLTGQMGDHAIPIFRQHFANPSLISDQIRELYRDLVAIDKYGTFTSIFIDQLHKVAGIHDDDVDVSDLHKEVSQLIIFCLRLAHRDHDEKIPLFFSGRMVSFAVILLAKVSRAELEGFVPYVRRLRKNIYSRAETIYIIAFPPAFSFFDQFLKRIRSDVDGIEVGETHRVRSTTLGRKYSELIVGRVAVLQREGLDKAFSQRLADMDIQVGTRVEGFVTGVSDKYATISAGGFSGVLEKKDASWIPIESCHKCIVEGQIGEFLVVEIDVEHQQLNLSARLPEAAVWDVTAIPREGEKIKVQDLNAVTTVGLVGTYENMSVIVPSEEVSWLDDWTWLEDLSDRDVTEAVVVSVDHEEKVIKGSIRATQEDPWPELRKKYRPGTRWRGEVVEINEQFVRLDLGDNIRANLHADRLKSAGYEYADFYDTMQMGQKLDVVVVSTRPNNRKITVDLQRNVEDRSEGGSVSLEV